MRMSCWKDKVSSVSSYMLWGLVAVFIFFQLYVVARLYFFASCHIPTGSMSPALISGDYIVVSLRIPGRREWKEIGSHQFIINRKSGVREVRVGDVVVFNYPYARGEERIVLCNDVYYCKRCVAVPGETYQWYEDGRKHSVYLPAQGEELALNSNNLRDYRRCIEYETNKQITLCHDSILLGDSLIRSYRFQRGYYFMRGDNVYDSYDSRFWGLLPDDFILGVARYIWFSQDSETGRIRWKRMFQSV